MPILMFTADEVAGGMIKKQRELCADILQLSDLNVKPLVPGESVAERYRKIAALGKKLAEAFTAFDEFMGAAVQDDTTEPKQEDKPVPPPNTN